MQNTSKLVSSRAFPITASTSDRFTATMQCALGFNPRAESNSQVPFRTAGTFSLMSIIVSTNASTTSSTLALRKNGVDANEIITIPGLTTGEFVDNTNTDTISAGDLICYRAKAGNNSYTSTCVSIIFNSSDTNQIITKCGTQNSLGLFGSSGLNTYECLVDFNSGGGDTEAHDQTKVRISGILKNLYVYISGNTCANAVTYKTRKNTADGNISVSITAGTTGTFENTSSTDTVVSGDLLAKVFVFAVGETGQLDLETTSLDFITTNPAFQFINGNSSSSADLVTAGATVYYYVGGDSENISSEASAQYVLRENLNFSNLLVNVRNNTNSTDETFRFRIDGVNANQVITITNGVTGFFEDSTHTDSVVSTQKISFQLVNGTGGQFALTTISMLASIPNILSPYPHFYLKQGFQ